MLIVFRLRHWLGSFVWETLMGRTIVIKLFAFLWPLFFNISGYCQMHRWAQSLISKNTDAYTVALDSNNNSYIGGGYQDTLTIGKQNIYPKSNNQTGNAYLAKFNEKGDFIWYQTIYTKNYTNGGNTLFINNVIVINNNRIMVYGYFQVSKGAAALMLSDKDSIKIINPSSSYNIVIAFVSVYDSTGKIIEYQKLFKQLGGGITITKGLIEKDKQNNIYLYGDISDGTIYSKKDSVKITAPGMSGVIKYKTGFDSILWVKNLSTFGRFGLGTKRIRVGTDNNLYLASVIAVSPQVINNRKYKIPPAFIKSLLIILSPNGNFIHSDYVNKDTTQQDFLTDVAAKDINTIYVTGAVQDSFFRNGKWYLPGNSKSKGSGYPFVGVIGISKGDKWIKLTRNKDSVPSFGFQMQSNYYSSVVNFNLWGDVFATFKHNYNILSIGGLTDSNRSIIGFAKFDSLGNALWLRSTFGISEIKPYKNAIVYCGIYKDSIKLKPYTLKGDYYKTYGFITSTQDYAIKRDSVYPGPYCAGDTIIVPYKKNGDYDAYNYFIAELSDENGNFEGKERELGRLKTTKDSVVIGKLPLFKVASSGKYRIRIRSTNPVVQSFYKFDVLRLLIYSKDKADPGLAESICRGDSIKLTTYGGTKWTWSPKYRMDDSTKRQPTVWPIRDTVYRIIIADSSGCGQPDTAFKKVFVRPYPVSILKFTDTMLCENIDLKIPVKFSGGDSAYQWQWFFVNSPKSFFPLQKGNSKFTDTLNYTTTVDLNTSEKIAIVLKDGCTAKADTAYLTISQRKPILIKTKFNDTSLCSGYLLNYKVLATGGVPKQYNYQWKDLITNTVLSTSDSFKFTTSKTLKIQLIVNDGCPALGDTAEFNITVKPPLKATANLRDTTICFGKTISYKAKAQGGDAKAYKFYWVLNNKLIDSTSTPTLTSTSTSTLTLILKDNCTIPNDTIKKTITIKPSPKADFTYDLACSRTITKFQFTGTKPPSPITTYFNWNFNNEATSTLENPTHKFAAAGTSTSTLTLASDNGCTDTLKKTIEIKPQSKADFETTDVCESDSAVFVNKSQDATGYNWKFGDGLNSKSQNPRHKFQISSTTTFNVTLVAVVNNGCSDSITKALTVNANPDSDFSFTTSGTKVDLRATVQGNTKYQWKFGNTDSATTTVGYYTHTIKSSDQYNVCLKVTNLAGCTSQTCKNVTVGITNISGSSGFKIYPNPNDGNFIIEIENPGKDVSVEIYNFIGNLVKTIETNSSKKSYSIEMKVADGIYFVKVKNGGVVWNQKVMISFGGDTNR